MSTFQCEPVLEPTLVSARVKVAQQKLFALRRSISRQSSLPFQHQDGVLVGSASLDDVLAMLPTHLGWGCDKLRGLRPSSDVPWGGDGADVPDNTAVSPAPAPVFTPDPSASVPVFPDIALALLKEKQVAAGRIWLLLRYLDSDGAGWVGLETVREVLTGRLSRLRVCGWRQMRNLLNEGESLFWVRRNGRLWLRSLPKVALSLDITRLGTDSVLLPLDILLAKIGLLRAHLYATFHSGRTVDGAARSERQGSAPIARATIEAMTQISPRIQRLYEKTAKVSYRSHFCIGPQFSPEQLKEAAWQHGRAFRLRDGAGLQGQAGCDYVAWQLPNSYAGPHQRLGKHRRKRMNRRLVDLLDKGIVGNDQLMDARADDTLFERRYFANGRFAAKALKPHRETAVYVQDQQRRNGFWYQMG